MVCRAPAIADNGTLGGGTVAHNHTHTTTSTTADARPRPDDRGLGEWLDKTEIAEALNISIRSLERRVAVMQFPAPVRFGRLLRWRRSTLDAHLRRLEAAQKN
jgi:predicted DNA-binding transcriptional regulator AlpA